MFAKMSNYSFNLLFMASLSCVFQQIPPCSDCGALRLLLLQVDSSETLSDSDAEGKALTEVHSIGVQVEDDKR